MSSGRDLELEGRGTAAAYPRPGLRPRVVRCGLGRASEASFEFCLSKSSSSAVSDSAEEAAELAELKLFCWEDGRATDFLEDTRKDGARSRTMISAV